MVLYSGIIFKQKKRLVANFVTENCFIQCNGHSALVEPKIVSKDWIKCQNYENATPIGNFKTNKSNYILTMIDQIGWSYTQIIFNII